MPSDTTSLILYVTYIEVFRDSAGFCDIFIVPVLPMTSPRRNVRMNMEFRARSVLYAAWYDRVVQNTTSSCVSNLDRCGISESCGEYEDEWLPSEV